MSHVKLSIVTLILLYYSSRLVIFLHFLQNSEKDFNITAQNMVFYFIPGMIEYHFVKAEMKIFQHKYDFFVLLTIFTLLLILTPLLHFLYVIYCCYKQFRFHYYASIDFPWFVPMSVIEIFESAPQCKNLRDIFFKTEDKID